MKKIWRKSDKHRMPSAVKDQDQVFLDRLYRLMEQESANPELDVERMCSALFISRSKLFYKMKDLTGMTPVAFLKQYRLDRAADLLRHSRFPISLISDVTGFSSPSKFSTLFRKRFGVPPSRARNLME